MPFKSEAQRKYLWANEPEIARDWTDTYGSGIQAAHGGRIPFALGSTDEMVETQYDTTPLSGQVAMVTDKQKQQMDRDIKLLNMGAMDLQTVYENAKAWDDEGSKGWWGIGKKEAEPMTPEEFKQEMINRGYLNSPAREEEDFNKLVTQGNLEGIEGQTASSGMFGTDATYVDDIKQPTSDSAFLYSPRGPEGIMKADTFIEDSPYIRRSLPYNELDDNEAQDRERQRIEERNRLANMQQYTTQEDEITGPNKWQQFLSKVTRQPYRAATIGAGGKTAAQLNRMNALGGYYSEPARQQRQLMNRRTNILKRAGEGKAVGNVNKLLGQYGYQGDVGKGNLRFTGTPQGDPSAGAGYSRSDDSWSASPFNRGGLATMFERRR